MQSADQPKTDYPSQPPPGVTDASAPGTAAPVESTSPKTGGLHLTEKIKGAVHVVHGATERFRGSIIGSWDSMVGKEEGEVSGIESKGKEEYERGMETLRPGYHAKTEQTGAQPGAGPGPQTGAAAGAAETQAQADTKAQAETQPRSDAWTQPRQEGGMQPGSGPQQPATQERAFEAGAAPLPGVIQSSPWDVSAPQAQGPDQGRGQEMDGKQGPIGYDVTEQRSPWGGMGEGGGSREAGPPPQGPPQQFED